MTTKDIYQELEQAKQMWAETILDKEELRDFYRRTYKVNYLKQPGRLVEPYEFRSGEYDENLDRATGLLSVPVQYAIKAKGLGPRPKEHAEKIEAFFNNVLPEIEYKDGQSFDNDLCHEVLNYGISAVSVLPDPKAWSDYPDAETLPQGSSYDRTLKDWNEIAPVPITIQHIPFLTWRPLLAGRTVVKSFQTQTVRAVELRYRYPDLELPADTKDTDEFEYVTYMDSKEVIYWVFKGTAGSSGFYGEPAKEPWRHHMSIDHAPVALYEGITTGDPELRYRWKGYGQSAKEPIRAKDMIISGQVTRSAISAVPTMDLEIEAAISPEQEAKLNKAAEYKLQGANVTIPGTKWVVKEFGNSSPVDEYVYKKLDMLTDSAFPPTLRGEVSAATSGFAFSLASEHALARLKPVQANMVRGDLDVGRLIIACIGAMDAIMGTQDATVHVRKSTDNATEAISVTYDDVKDYGALLDASREAQLPQDTLANLQAVDMAINAAKLPRSWAYQEILKAENPQELMDEWDAEQLMEQEPLKSTRNNNILRRMQVLRDQVEGLTTEQAAGMSNLPPAAQRVIQGMGNVGATAPPEMPPGAAPPPGAGTQMPAGPPQGGSSVMAEKGVSVRPRNPRPRNPRAGQRSQPGGPKQKSGSVQVKA